MTEVARQQTNALTIVLGMHRSGTSLCSHALSLLGLDMADEITPHESNARGHWERWELIKLNDRVLKHFDHDYYTLPHATALPAGWWAEPEVRTIRDEIVGWLRTRMAGSPRFGLKDPRISRLLPMWWEVFAELGVQPRFIFCLRNAPAVASSLTARDGFAHAQGEYLWLIYNLEAVAGIAGAPVTIVPYDTWFTDPLINMKLLDEAVPGPGRDEHLFRKIIGSVVDPALRHQLSEPSPHDGGICAQFYRLLQANPRRGGFSSEVRMAAHLCDGFAGIVDPMRLEILRLGAAEAALKQAQDDLARQSQSFGSLKAELARQTQALNAANAELAKGKEALEATKAELAKQNRSLDAARAELAKEKQSMESTKGDLEKEKQSAKKGMLRDEPSRLA